ncbi:MAG: NADH-quinone oxidoreductase subunit M [Opitutales bacterium]|nr:NADH-quinone oxidoreductase subunit M [Opitutales bacterium]
MVYYSIVTTVLIYILLFYNYPKQRKELIKYFTLLSSLFLFILSIMLWIYFNPYEQTFQFNFICTNIEFSFYFGLDGISLLFIFLTTFLFPICLLYNWNNIYKITGEFCLIMISMELLLIAIFATQNILFFYICFEIALVPLFILIGINNIRKRRIHAAYLLFLYTLMGSLFMLITIIYLYSISGSFNYYVLYNVSIDPSIQKLMWLFLFISLAVKIPLFPFHIWLPEAHVEAPTEGSIILAGVLLKLGIYGYIRILIPIFYQATLYYMPLVFTIAIISGVYASMSTLRQTDIKRVIAYSSIAHMSIGIFGLFTLKPIGMVGSIILMFSHGIVSGALFLIIGILYDRFKTKTLFYFNGLVQLMPLTATMFFLFILGNISFPGTSSFIGETLVLIDVANIQKGSLLFIAIILLLCTLYSLLLFNKVFFGLSSIFKVNSTFDLTRRELHMIIPFVFIMLWIGIYPHAFVELIESNIYFIYFNT